jgi:glycosyltransferase involved in cell wall biosynthesis
MRIAFVSDVDPYDRAAFSGTTYQILQIILATGAKVEVFGPMMDPVRFSAIRVSTLPYRLMGRGVAWPKHPFLLKPCGSAVDAAARAFKPDVIFSPGSNAIAYSNFIKPTIFWSDAPFAAMADYYPWPQFQNLTDLSREFGMAADTRALRYATAAIYRSNWGREAAIREHQADPARVHVLHLSGNLFRRWSLEEIQALVPARLESPWKIFFNGVEWKRKGGDHAVAVINALVELGQPCELRIAGVLPPPGSLAAAKFPVKCLGRLNLNQPGNRDLLSNILQSSTFLVVPSTAEALALVFCEALAAGVPCVGRDTGGVSDAILDGKTGFLIQPDETPQVTARRMLEAGRNPKIYSALVTASWNEWTTSFANSAVLRKLTHIIERAAAAGRGENVPPKPLTA